MLKFGPGACRCDKAEELCISIGDVSYSFKNHWQETDDGTITLFSPLLTGETIRFEKAGNGQQTLQ